MVPFPTQTRTWDLNTAANGIWFNDEFVQIYANFSGLEAVVDNQFIAGATVNNGRAVEMIRSKIQEGIGNNQEYGTAEAFALATTDNVSIVSLTKTKIFIAYRNTGSSGFGTAIVADISGTVPTFGTAVEFALAATIDISVVALMSSKIVIAYQDTANGGFGTAIVADISGTVPTFGTEIAWNASTVTAISAVALTSSKIIVAYEDIGNSAFGTVIVINISGTVPSFGSPVVFEGSATNNISVAALSSTNIIIGYQASATGKAIAASISGTVPTFGSSYPFNSAVSTFISVVAMTSTLAVISYATSSLGFMSIMTINNTFLQKTSAINLMFKLSNVDQISAIRLDKNRLLISFSDLGNSSRGTALIIDIREIDNIKPIIVFESGTSDFISATLLSGSKIAIAYQDEGNSDHGTAIIADISKFLGVSQEVKILDELIYVTMSGISKAHSGLEIDTDYYSDDGTLKKTSIILPDDIGKRKIGRAISTTEILLDDQEFK